MKNWSLACEVTNETMESGMWDKWPKKMDLGITDKYWNNKICDV